MRFLLDADDDWIEGFRRFWYPRFHPVLQRVGGYGTGVTRIDQYVGTFDEDEEVIEDELVRAGGRRNALACFKSLPDGRESEGSWRFLRTSDPSGLIAPGMQVHVTLFERGDGFPGRELYAHYEDDWGVAPGPHLRGENFSAVDGVAFATVLIDDYTYLTRR